MPQDQIQIKTPEFVSLQFKLSGLGSRATAMIIDQVLLTVVNTVLLFALIFILESDFIFSVGGYPGWIIAIWILALFIINMGYFFFSEYFFNGKTIGKNILGIRVIQDNGHSITLLSAFIRNLLRVIDMLPTGYFVGIILIFLNSKHKRLGDMAAGTIVVHERKRKQRKKSSLEKEVEKRNLDVDNLQLDEWAMNALGNKEYNLLKTYSFKLMEMPEQQRNQLTTEMAAILFPKVGLSMNSKTNRELEDMLLILYLKVKDDWEFEL